MCMDKGNYIGRFDQVLSALCDRIGTALAGIPPESKTGITEIRLRCGQPVICTTAEGPLFFPLTGGVCRMPRAGLLHAEREDLEETFRRICEYSVYTHQAELNQGYVTMRGGHRAGICGRAVVSGGQIESIQDICAVNLRIAHEIKGAADSLISGLTAADGVHTVRSGLLLAGPPGSGKTTLLRDLTRQLSSGALGAPMRVTVVDERGELGAVWDGAPQNDLGPCTDILTGCPKALGIEMAVRSMAPEIVVFDELGTMEEAEAVGRCLHAGAAAVTTVHAGDLAGLCRRPQAMRLLDSGAVGQVALLREPGQAPEIYSREEVYAQVDRIGCTGRGGGRHGAILLRPSARAHRTA